MQQLQLFMRQIEASKNRSKDALNLKTISKSFLHNLDETKVNTALEAVAEGNKTVFNDLALVEAIKEKQLDQSEKAIVDTKHISKFFNTNNIDLSRFVSDKQFRERVIKGDDNLDFVYLEDGVFAGQAICRIVIASEEGEEGFGTGFLIGPSILITNNHVLPNADLAKYSYAEFQYEKGRMQELKTTKAFRLNPEILYYTNEELDYTIVHVNENSTDQTTPISNFGFLKLNPQLGKTKEGNFVSIIQHPDGKMKKVAIRENKITNLQLPKVIRYVTDTKSGSSGAPVFNDKWEVVALHHSGIPRYNESGKVLNINGGIWDESQGETAIDWVENEGIRISSIVYDITTQAASCFPFLLNHFTPLTDIETISRSMGIDKKLLERDVYYPEAKDRIDKENYYQSIGDLATVSFSALHTLLNQTHSVQKPYNPSKFLYPNIDVHPDGLLRSIYSGKEFTADELILADEKVNLERKLKVLELSRHEKTMNAEAYNKLIEGIEESLPYNCEHVVCQSWFNKEQPMRGDLHHLFACESKCNSFRNNHPYFDFPHYDPKPQANLEKEKLLCGNMEQGLFEPENNKGMVARAVLYFFVRYPKQTNVYKENDLEMLKEWAKSQPVTLYEQHRNREIFLVQGNRNPFIDFPEIIESFDFSQGI